MMLQIDDDELEALIDFQRAMIALASESLEEAEVAERKARLQQLIGKRKEKLI